MARRALTDDHWEVVKYTLKSKGCYITSNTRDIIEGIIWKIRVGSPWRDIPSEFGPWQTIFNRFNRWAKNGLWDDFFLLYEEKLTKKKYTETDVMLQLTSMRVELGLERNAQSVDQEGDLHQKYMPPPTRVETRLILKSLGVKSTTAKLLNS